MADALTSDYDFTKPEVGGSDDTWGTKLNANWELVDDILTSAFTPPVTADGTSGPLKASVLPATATTTGTWTFAAAVVTGSTSLATLGTSGLATLSSLSVTTTSALVGAATVGSGAGWTLSHADTNQSVTLSGGSTGVLGANLVLQGEAAANPGDFALNDDITPIIDYDASATSLLLLNATVTNAGLSLASANNVFTLSRDTNAKQLNLSGGSGAGDSAELRLHGSADASPNNYEFLIGGTSTYQYDHAGLSHTFKTGTNNHLVTGVGSAVFGNPTTTQFNLLRSGTAEILGIFGGSSAENGGGLKLWGGAHATVPNNFALMSSTNNIVQYDAATPQLNLAVAATIQARFTSNNMALGDNGTQNYTISRAGTADQLNLSGGNGAGDGGNIQLHGSASTGAEGDIVFRSAATEVGKWDESADAWSFTAGTVHIGAPVSTIGAGATDGLSRISSGELRSSRGPENATLVHMRYYDITGSAGTITTDGSGNCAYNNPSDERLKTDFRGFDGLGRLRDIKMYDYALRSNGKRFFGPRAQELHKVFPNAVTVGGEDPREDPWSYDASKLVPLLVRAVQQLEERINDIH